MKKYVTFVKDEEESRKVQEALFKAGFEWGSVGENVAHSHLSFLRMNEYGGGTLEVGKDFSIACDKVHKGYVAIDAHRIIDNPFQLDGATQPEKMIMIGGKEISESTIKAALQEYVK